MTMTAFRTITAQVQGTCRRCGGPIAIGQTIRSGGDIRVYHMAADCPNGTGYTDDPPFAHLGNYDDPRLSDSNPVTQ